MKSERAKNASRALPDPKELPHEKENSLERSKFVYEQISRWIENAENKVSVSCGIFTGVFGVVTFLSERYIASSATAVVNECWNRVHKVCFVISLVIMAVSIFFFIRSITPNLKSSGNVKATVKEYPIFYGDIQLLELEQYKDRVLKVSDSAFCDELENENWHNAGICMKKMQRYKRGLFLSLIAIGFAFLSFATHYLAYYG